MTQSTTRGGGDETGDDYVIRPYEHGDASDVQALYSDVWGLDVSERWLAQQYTTNPYVDGTTMIVAAVGDDVVGARPFVPLPFRAGNEDGLALYLSDLMVHPDHRRQGLFTRMTTRILEQYRGGPAAFTLNFGNELSAPGYRKMGFTAVGRGQENHVRVQNTSVLVRGRVPTPFDALASTVADTAAAGYLAVRRALRGDGARYRIERSEGLPADRLAALYSRSPPTALHTRRDAAFYRWLDGHPEWAYETYLVTIDDDDAAAVVVQRRGESDTDVAWIADVVPVASTRHRPFVAALLDAVVANYRETDVLSVSGPIVYERLLPTDVLADFGFHSTRHPVLSRFTGGDSTAFVYPLREGDGDPLTVGSLDVRDPENWQVQIR